MRVGRNLEDDLLQKKSFTFVFLQKKRETNCYFPQAQSLVVEA